MKPTGCHCRRIPAEIRSGGAPLQEPLERMAGSPEGTPALTTSTNISVGQHSFYGRRCRRTRTPTGSVRQGWPIEFSDRNGAHRLTRQCSVLATTTRISAHDIVVKGQDSRLQFNVTQSRSLLLFLRTVRFSSAYCPINREVGKGIRERFGRTALPNLPPAPFIQARVIPHSLEQRAAPVECGWNFVYLRIKPHWPFHLGFVRLRFNGRCSG